MNREIEIKVITDLFKELEEDKVLYPELSYKSIRAYLIAQKAIKESDI